MSHNLQLNFAKKPKRQITFVKLMQLTNDFQLKSSIKYPQIIIRKFYFKSV